MGIFVDVYHLGLNKDGEELCGDQVRVLRDGTRNRVILSDGLGSGVKANILATMTSEILATMLKEDVPLAEVIKTVSGTLPICQVRKIAYATCTVIEVDEATQHFRVMNFDNPPVFCFRQGKLRSLADKVIRVYDKDIHFCEGELEKGDFLAVISDGVWYAGLGHTYNFGWGWEKIADFMADILQNRVWMAQDVVDKVMDHTLMLYGGHPGDDATMVGLLVRPRRSALVFTGPPTDRANDEICAQRLLSFEGRRIVCGGTTGQIVARAVGQEIETQVRTLRSDVPPVGRLKGVHLLTEGILTMSRALEIIQASKGDIAALPDDNNGAVLLALELLASDDITFLVGLQVNPFYQNPILPKVVSIRKTLIDQLVAELRALNKAVSVDYV